MKLYDRNPIVKKYYGSVSEFNKETGWWLVDIKYPHLKESYLDTINGLFAWMYIGKIPTNKTHKLKSGWSPGPTQDINAYNTIEETNALLGNTERDIFMEDYKGLLKNK